MSRDWEAQFKLWARPPSKTEEERIQNTLGSIRRAINQSEMLSKRSLKVFVQGSYRNRVNVRKESDVDIGVLCDESFIPLYPENMTKEDFGNVSADYGYGQFKEELLEALVRYFGSVSVHRGNKAIEVRENSYHVDADVVPFFEYRRYWEDGTYRCGVALRPDNGGRIHNYPERLLDSWPNTPLHYENGVSKNESTGRSYKGCVRIIKSLRNEMEENSIASAIGIPGFLIECMVWNAPNSCFAHSTWDGDIQSVMSHIWSNTREDSSCNHWHEVNDIKFLFHSTQKWTRAQAYNFVNSAWDYIGVRQ